MINQERLNYLHIGALITCRFFLRSPFLVALLIHHYQLRLSRVNQNLIFPKEDKLEFTTYKEKVLYIINQIRLQFGKVICMSHPNNDLAWCAFVIENDYLQISNSISSSTQQMNSANTSFRQSFDEQPKKEQ